MRIFADKLANTLQRQLHPVYLLFGGEPLLIQESRDQIEHRAKSEGFSEVFRFSITAQTDWNEVFDACNSMSLFAEKKILQLELPESGTNQAITKELLNLHQVLNPDVILIVSGSKLTKAQENAKWFKALNSNGLWVSCLTPDIQRLPQFVLQRCHQLGLKPDTEAVQMLAQWHEGNLLALSQSLEKLCLLYPDGVLTLVRIESALSRHNHFTVFNWIDAMLEGKAKRSQRILRELHGEGIEAVILLRTLQKELNTLMSYKQELTSKSLQQVFDQYRVWNNKRPLYTAALNRHTPKTLYSMVCTLAQAEHTVKTDYDNSVWPILTQLTLDMSMPRNA
ncbi:DNA polymerase III subunit delta [Vibrio breoganii]|uniref:DNA polymerase III subunit delta n=1 Tax=Vibrio breoganii TaxID=553239 RepID=UPI000C8200F9|nr:DNA polymerase III subunit delta [Vibrio breoganii]PMG95560.1 DNA polymerase III subunit delta [Vibrio breoganii]PMJ44847.1 DNA polymerase III subunit delta [Vibrio breoganii]PMK51836.1 DNA polymerase III subunit delta [Vibrio breoganii]PMM83591.1 DNA polymerase III subunit delta [Vibrio breoganii]PMO26862.1 DNA polymerase III subunit delta [Vibrio breoganii]